MIKLCRDNHLIWPMEAVVGPNFYPINPAASQILRVAFVGGHISPKKTHLVDLAFVAFAIRNARLAFVGALSAQSP